MSQSRDPILTGEETYLGDGLYARWEAGTFWLRAPRLYSDHVIALEPEVFTALRNFETKVRAALRLEAMLETVDDEPATTLRRTPR